MLVFVLNQAQKANTGKIQTPVYENVREFGNKPGISPGFSFCLQDMCKKCTYDILSCRNQLLTDCSQLESQYLGWS